ncbi:MAG: YgiT-type zinc finger protein [Myxococcaceae bacterium]|nr:YgiT-type zinc finger protein [Myxococcaceae bacterium]
MADYGKRDYGRCPCGGQYEHRAVEVRMTVQGKVVVLTDVPQGACPQCGSRVYKAEVLERIESLMKGDKVRRVQ